jgi:rRNA maturation RNase YbeY
MAVSFSYADRTLGYNRKRKLKTFLPVLAKKEGRVLEALNYVFCSDDYLLDMNRQFLQHDYYTDIITFDLGVPGAKGIVGEVYISIDRVKDNARSLGVSFEDELVRVVCHGLLHLCGYRDKKKVEQAAMRQAEDKYLKLFHKQA